MFNTQAYFTGACLAWPREEGAHFWWVGAGAGAGVGAAGAFK